MLRRDLKILGSLDKAPLVSENPARKNARRSLVATRRIKKGDILRYFDLTWKRPGHGISPRDIQEIVGARARVTIAQDAVIMPAMIQR